MPVPLAATPRTVRLDAIPVGPAGEASTAPIPASSEPAASDAGSPLEV
jgi:hypothetical protein